MSWICDCGEENASFVTVCACGRTPGYALDDYCDPDDYDLPFGSCEGCECDVARGDAEYIRGEIFCQQCAWARTPASERGRRRR